MEFPDHIPKLVELVPFRLVSAWLDIQWAGNARVVIDEVTPSRSIQRKPEPNKQRLEFSKRDHPAALDHSGQNEVRRSLRHGNCLPEESGLLAKP
jgi:hypothetical protein